MEARWPGLLAHPTTLPHGRVPLPGAGVTSGQVAGQTSAQTGPVQAPHGLMGHPA